MPEQTLQIILTTFLYFFRALEIFLIAYIIMSWLPIKPNNPLVQFIRSIVEPLLSPVRRLIQKSVFGGRTSMLDFSPIIVFIILAYLQRFIDSILRGL
ncbi:YggT family protein [Natranaerovirga pectinivora]|uniref:YggT family protein n=1 Tax=Natranaerovirga pectinivora TaxID=682400 RepID=A0A4R3MKI7_9FIRM|nr:YggT family protein [Natranaerovirga pectinivora]TCT14953.1 YggT family protein [Natranaerovirga pectinivora]